MSTVLEETLCFLLKEPNATEREIRGVYINNYFTVVELDDGSVGACMSSFRYTPAETEEKLSLTKSSLKSDPLLIAFTDRRNGKAEAFKLCIRAATASALSTPFIRAGGDSTFRVDSSFPHSFFKGIESVIVVGFGGLLDYFIMKARVKRVYVSDLLLNSRRDEFSMRVSEYRQARPELEITLSDGADIEEHLDTADALAITGSTLGNGTIDELLSRARQCPKIVLQGQSAGIHPRELFASGVRLVATTLKPQTLARRAFADPTGSALRPLLEGGLPWIYLSPRVSG